MLGLSFFKNRTRGIINPLHEKMKDIFISWRQTYSRGLGYYDLLKQPAIAMAALKIFNVPFMFLIGLIPLWFIGWYAVGWLDRFKVNIWQKEAEWGSRVINPFEQELMDRLKNIEANIHPLKQEPNNASLPLFNASLPSYQIKRGFVIGN